jgi:hypothetical protein
MRLFPLVLIRTAAERLLDRWRPGSPAGLEGPHPEAGGGGILYASTAAHPGGGDVSINANGSRLVSNRLIDCGDGLNFYDDAELSHQLGELGHAQTLQFLGGANGPAPGLAVLYATGTPYDDKQQRDTVVYVNPDHVGEPYARPEEPEPEPGDIAARDAEWRAWLEGDSSAPDR